MKVAWIPSLAILVFDWTEHKQKSKKEKEHPRSNYPNSLLFSVFFFLKTRETVRNAEL